MLVGSMELIPHHLLCQSLLHHLELRVINIILDQIPTKHNFHASFESAPENSGNGSNLKAQETASHLNHFEYFLVFYSTLIFNNLEKKGFFSRALFTFNYHINVISANMTCLKWLRLLCFLNGIDTVNHLKRTHYVSRRDMGMINECEE